MDSAPVIAITGLTFHDLIDTRFMQDVNTVELMKGVALYNTAVTSPGHALVVTDIACRTALGGRGVVLYDMRYTPLLHRFRRQNWSMPKPP